jgi:hypothetical protein
LGNPLFPQIGGRYMRIQCTIVAEFYKFEIISKQKLLKNRGRRDKEEYWRR